VLVIVAVKSTEPDVCVTCGNVGVGVGLLTRTYVVVVAAMPRRPPVTVVLVDVKAVEPDVCVIVARGVHNGMTLFKHETTLELTWRLSTLPRKQFAAVVSPN
jgi:hypothetical protein